MKKSILLALTVVTIFSSCNNQNAKTDIKTEDSVATVGGEMTEQGPKGKIEYVSNTYEFGTVKEGAIVEHVFKFKNTGEAPVILAQVTASCGCTTPDYSKDPILPGNEGEVKVAFDSKGQVGTHQKIVTVVSNAENNITTVQIKGTVEK